jgi:Lrp/AsnC family transcriptional regulator for asnA, asnC and gidA
MTLADGELDKLEQEIIMELQKDARKSFKSIAAKLNVSESTISNRVNRLIEHDILKLEARVNPFQLKNKVVALIGINLNQRDHEAIIKKIEEIPGVTSVWVTTGKYDLYAEVMVDSINDLNNFIFRKGLGMMDSVSFTETNIMLHSQTKYFKI